MAQFVAPDKMNTMSLVATLEQWRTAYYNQSPAVSDAVYDQYEDYLRATLPQHPFLLKIGAPAPIGGSWPKAKHGQAMTSLNKAQTIPELTTFWFDVRAEVHGAFGSHKMDGISISLRYDRGYMSQAVTRGDGEVGEDITRNVRLMQGAVKQVPKGWSGFVRGEIVVCHDDFATYFKGESNPRNTASGCAKRQTGYEKCAHLTIFVYRALPDAGLMDSKDAEFKWLKKCGFYAPMGVVVKTVAEAQAIYDEHIATARAKLNYDIDGIVWEINNNEIAEDMGLKGSNPKAGIALKFPHETAITTLRAVRWQVGNSGRITPVAEFDMVSLGGANVKQATLHNVGRVTGLKLWKGCTIEVSKRNDVIPGVEANINDGINVSDLE